MRPILVVLTIGTALALGSTIADARRGGGASGYAPGHISGPSSSARNYAPGQQQIEPGSAKTYAPGHQFSNPGKGKAKGKGKGN